MPAQDSVSLYFLLISLFPTYKSCPPGLVEAVLAWLMELAFFNKGGKQTQTQKQKQGAKAKAAVASSFSSPPQPPPPVLETDTGAV